MIPSWRDITFLITEYLRVRMVHRALLWEVGQMSRYKAKVAPGGNNSKLFCGDLGNRSKVWAVRNLVAL